MSQIDSNNYQKVDGSEFEKTTLNEANKIDEEGDNNFQALESNK